MEIKLKDIVFCLRTQVSFETCDGCEDGTVVVKLRNGTTQEIVCPKCHGSMEITKKEKIVIPVSVFSIMDTQELTQNGYKFYRCYNARVDDFNTVYLREDEVFTTIEAAKKALKKGI